MFWKKIFVRYFKGHKGKSFANNFEGHKGELLAEDSKR